MTVKITRAVREMILDNTAMNTGPLINQHGRTLMRYDRIVISKDKIEFMFGKYTVFYFDMPYDVLQTGGTVNVTGVEGAMPCGN